jgi:hypothetical protein
MMIRLAALAAMGAAPASWLANIAVAKQANVTAEEGMGLLKALAPLIGTARVVSAAGGILRALGLAEMLDDDDQ